jgi:cytochrome c553
MKQAKAWPAVAAFTFAFTFASGAASAADAVAGKAKAALCEACHGAGGNSATPTTPNLAGQPAQFISTELYFFREGNRKDAQMTPIAATLSNADMNDLAAYFSSLKPAPPARKASPENEAAGPALTKKFMCTQCHGPQLLGVQHIPRLAGQQADYLRTQLQGFKAQTRADIDGNMTSAAQALGESDIATLADYISGLVSP